MMLHVVHIARGIEQSRCDVSAGRRVRVNFRCGNLASFEENAGRRHSALTKLFKLQ